MRQPIRQPCLRHSHLQRHHLVVRCCGRLVAHHGKARLKGSLCNRQVQVVRRGDHHKVDSICPWLLRPDHLPVICVCPFRSDSETLASCARPLRRLRERPSHHLNPAIQFGGHPVHRTNKCPRPPANHPHAQLPPHRIPPPQVHCTQWLPDKWRQTISHPVSVR